MLALKNGPKTDPVIEFAMELQGKLVGWTLVRRVAETLRRGCPVTTLRDQGFAYNQAEARRIAERIKPIIGARLARSVSAAPTLQDRFRDHVSERLATLYGTCGLPIAKGSRWVPGSAGTLIVSVTDETKVSVERCKLWSSNGKYSAERVNHRINVRMSTLMAAWNRGIYVHNQRLVLGLEIDGDRGTLLVVRKGRGHDIYLDKETIRL
jgi:hypothetical protein